MTLNYKLAIKVLKEMDHDFIKIEATLLEVKHEETRNLLFKEVREHRAAVAKLLLHYQKVLAKMP